MKIIKTVHEIWQGRSVLRILMHCALENISIIENEKLFENAENASRYLHKRLSESILPLSIVGSIRHAGLLFGIDLVDENNGLLCDLEKIEKIRNMITDCISFFPYYLITDFYSILYSWYSYSQ